MVISKRNTVALIPARSGSTRVSGKNIRCLGDHPLLAYTIAAARASGVFDAVVVSTDDAGYADISRHYGAETPFLRPAEYAGATSPDIEWVRHALHNMAEGGRSFESFSILRPTSPFRTAATIQRAWRSFCAEQGIDSLRAVEKCTQHPGKMWMVRGQRLLPLLPFENSGTPWHSCQYSTLPEVYVQNASLEIAWTRVVEETDTIAGHVVAPFLTEGHEGFDINTPEDWWYAEHLLASGAAPLPIVDRPSFLQLAQSEGVRA